MTGTFRIVRIFGFDINVHWSWILIFILLTPFTDAGLQFTIDYTGGTKWEIRFKDASVTPDQVEAIFTEQGLTSSAVTTGSGFIEIKTEPIGLVLQRQSRLI